VKKLPVLQNFGKYKHHSSTWAQFGGGQGARVPPTFSDGGTYYVMSRHFFLFRFHIWRGFKNKSDVCHVLSEELFMLDGRSHIAKLMLKQSLVCYRRFC